MIIYNYYFAILILAVIFFLLSTKNPSILISIIIIIILGYYYFNYIQNNNDKVSVNDKNQIATLEKDIDTSSNNLIYYLNNDKHMINFLFNIRFIKIFDSHKFSNIIILFEKLMKLYIFMLGDRYDITIFFSTFMDTRSEIIKELYSSYLITPIKLKYIYNLNPYDEIKKTIEDFKKHTRAMIIILEKYAYQKKGIYYLNDTKHKPFENNIMEVY